MRTLRLTVGLLVVPMAWSSVRADAPPRGQRVFVCGHSFHMPIAEMLDQIARSAGIADHRLAGKQGIGGSTVTKHWEVPDPMNKVKNALRAGAVDVLTLSPHLLLPDPAIDQFTTLLLEHNPQGRVTVQASWHPYDGPRVELGKFKNEQRDAADPSSFRTTWAPFTDRVRAQVKALNENLTPAQRRQVVFVVPVGDAVIRLRERVVKGRVPGIAKQSELFRDDLGHGKAPLYVLNAYCHYAVIYGRSPIGLPVPAALQGAGLGENTAAVNRALQKVAWEAALAEPLSGVSQAK